MTIKTINRKYAMLRAILFLLGAIFQGCGNSGAELKSISIEPSFAYIDYNGARQFKAIGTFSDSSTRDITYDVNWASSDSAKITINESGRATASEVVLESPTEFTVTATMVSPLGQAVSGEATLLVWPMGWIWDTW